MTLSYRLFHHVVIQNKQLHQHIFSNITEVNRIRNNASSKCNCRELGGAYGDLVFETYSLHTYKEYNFCECHDKERLYRWGGNFRSPLYCRLNTMTLEWCCQFGTPSLLYDLVSQIYYSLINVNGSTPSSAQKYMKDNVLNLDTIYQLFQTTFKSGNVEVFKYLLQIADYTGITREGKNIWNQLISLFSNESNHQIVIKYQPEYPITKYCLIFIRLYKENTFDYTNIIKNRIIDAMQYGYVEQLQFLLELTKVSNVNSPLNTKEFLNYLMEVYSGHKFDCLKRSQSVYSSWKTTKQIKIDICINQSLKLNWVYSCNLKKHKTLICIKLRSGQQEYQSKIFNTGTSKFYLVMLIMVEYIKSIMDDDIIHLNSSKYQIYNSVGNLASIYRDHQGIEYLLELGFPIEYVWDLESIKIIKEKNKDIPINAHLIKSYINTPIETFQYLLDNFGGIEYLSNQYSSIIEKQLFIINKYDATILPIIKQMIDYYLTIDIRNNDKHSRKCFIYLTMGGIEISIKEKKINWLHSFISLLNQHKNEDLPYSSEINYQKFSKDCIKHSMSTGSIEMVGTIVNFLNDVWGETSFTSLMKFNNMTDIYNSFTSLMRYSNIRDVSMMEFNNNIDINSFTRFNTKTGYFMMVDPMAEKHNEYKFQYKSQQVSNQFLHNINDFEQLDSWFPVVFQFFIFFFYTY